MEETKDAARKEHTDLANQYTQETDAIVKTLKELDNQLEETAYEKDKALLELNRYKLEIYQGTEQKEGVTATLLTRNLMADSVDRTRSLDSEGGCARGLWRLSDRV